MNATGSNEGKADRAQPSMRAIYAAQDKKKRITILLIVAGILVAAGLIVLFQYWHPLWRFQAGYVSKAQFGEEGWPFTVPEAKVICIGPAEMLLETRAGIFGMTKYPIALGYTSLEDANIWKWDPTGWKNRVPADKFWTYMNTLCR